MKKVVISSRSFGSISNEPFALLESAGFSHKFLDASASRETLMAELADSDAMIAGTVKIDAELLGACKQLQVIARYGAGVDNIDLNAAKALGITVTNTAGVNAEAVADLAFGLILDVRRGISRANQKVHQGQYKYVVGRDVYKKTLGLIGFGAIAQGVARRAAGFSMQVLAYDPYLKEIPAEFQSYVTLCGFDELVTQSDIVSIHVPLTPETKAMFNTAVIQRMKADAALVNLGRGGIIDEADLYTCMKAGHLLGAGLDVTAKEPIEPDNPLLTLDNVTITPHMGMFTAEVIHTMSMVCAQNVVKKFQGEALDFVVV